MNYLGHMLLAAPDSALMAGGLLGDFVKGPIPDSLPEDLRAGVRLHRAIDAWSDRHETLSDLREVLPPEWSRFCGILVDLWTDHHIARRPDLCPGSSLEDFCDNSLEAVEPFIHHFSEAGEHRYRQIRDQSWLTSYASRSFTAACLQRIGRRIRFANPLGESKTILEQHAKSLDTASAHMLLDSQKFVAKWRAENIEPFCKN